LVSEALFRYWSVARFERSLLYGGAKGIIKSR
jgi:hypothetical protein